VLNFRELFARGVGQTPFPYQERLAQANFNRIFLNVPTGAGKTAAAFFAWIWQRRFADDSVRSRTPRRLVYCLPMRVLVEQTRDVINEWLIRLRLHTEIRVAVLMGGEERDGWDLFPEREAILIGTQDMLLSRAMNRGYGISRYRWPVHFALVNNDCHWVVDEVQLMGNGLASTTQLQAFRERFGTQGRVSTLWMSATLETEWLKTVDFDGQGSTIAIDENDLRLSDELRKRVEASKPLHEASASADQVKELAAEILDRHRPATRTLIVVNTVKRAVELYRQIGRVKPAAGLALIHSRFRASDRERALAQLLADPGPKGSIIVSTQVVEAGVDVSATTLVTEIAPWSSLVQRFGRCNRTGRDDGAAVYWIGPEKRADLETFAPPYDLADLGESFRVLRDLKEVGPVALKDSSASTRFVHRYVLRRRDLEELFDTTPDLAGRDIDVSRFIRETDDLDVQVFWRGLADDDGILMSLLPSAGNCAPHQSQKFAI
jgi:CRISPR-associated endonuclease/helicase Cas3